MKNINLKNFFNKIVKKIKNIWFKKVTQPKLERIKRLEIIKAEKALHTNFKTMYGVSSKSVKNLMNKIDKEYWVRLQPTDKKYLSDKLIEGKRFINSQPKKTPFHYDVDTVNIHNEYFVKDDGLSLIEVKNIDADESKRTLEQQQDKIRFNQLDEKIKNRIKLIKRQR